MEKQEKIYITGHKVPDTDTICASISYGELLKETTNYKIEPIRLGDLNNETKFVLDYFNVKQPRLKDSLKLKVHDLAFDKPTIISKDAPLKKAIELLQEKKSYLLNICEEDKKLKGVISLSDITRCYMNIWDDLILAHSKTPFLNIVDVLSANVLNTPAKEINGKMVVFAMNPEALGDKIKEDDIVIVGDRDDAQNDAIKRNVSLLIISGGYKMKEETFNRAKEKGIGVIQTKLNSFMASRLLPLSVPVSYIMTTENIDTVDINQTVDDAKEEMAKSRFRAYPVVDPQGKVVGTISRYHLITGVPKKVILVDHNEKAQTIDDIEQAEILEIIDHHRIEAVKTLSPIFFRNEPVGSTATIIAKMYFEKGIRPRKEIAGLLSSAIISDTLLFRSPTTTDDDRRMLERLAPLAGISPEEFALKMFKAGTSISGKTVQELLKTDVKEFTIEGEQVRVAQIFTLDKDEIIRKKDEFLTEMEKERSAKNEATFVFIITDIFEETSIVLVVGKNGDKFAREFDTNIKNGMFEASGLLSRKKQAIPALTRAFS